MPRIELPKPRQIVRAYLLSIGIWCCLSLLTGWQYKLYYQDESGNTSLLDMLLVAESQGLGFALMTPPVFYLVRRHIGSSRRSFWYWALYVLGAGPFMVLYACIRWALLPPWDTVMHRFVHRSGTTPLTMIRGGFANQITMYIAIVVAAHAYEYFERVRNQDLERSEYQQALAASELQALKMQLHPHFLFNTLHGISTLIGNDPGAATTMIMKLSNLLRTALRQSGSDLIRLQDELSFVDEYLDLEQMRFGARLRVTRSIASDTLQIQVPQLILQPLVENAIRHGVASRREGGFIAISSRRDGEVLELKVRNSIGNSTPKGDGVGLRNTEARLRHLYMEEASLSFAVAQDQTATTTLRFPALGSGQASAAQSAAPAAAGIEDYAGGRKSPRIAMSSQG